MLSFMKYEELFKSIKPFQVYNPFNSLHEFFEFNVLLYVQLVTARVEASPWFQNKILVLPSNYFSK